MSEGKMSAEELVDEARLRMLDAADATFARVSTNLADGVYRLSDVRDAVLIALLVHHIATLQREAEEAAGAFDANVLRLKACECIAEGEEGWQTVRDACPSAAAVATLRDQFEALQREADGMREALEKIAANAPTEFQDWPGGGTADDEYMRGIENQHFALAHIARAALNGPPQDDGAKGSDL